MEDGNMGLGDGEECPEGDTQDTNKNKEGGATTTFRIQGRGGGAAAVATAGPLVIPGSLLQVRGERAPAWWI